MNRTCVCVCACVFVCARVRACVGDGATIGMLVVVLPWVCLRMDNDRCVGSGTTIGVLMMVLRLVYW